MAAEKPASLEGLAGLGDRLRQRQRLANAIREYFNAAGFLEIETPLITHAPAPEEHIDAIPVRNSWLRTSPELEMKCLLAAGYERIFQLGPCFRAGEHGRLHREEFTMLEWYQAGIDYRELLGWTREMLRTVFRKILGGEICEFRKTRIDIGADWEIIPVADAFANFANCSPEAAIEKDCFDELLLEKIEPALPRTHPVVLIDYPARLAALSRRKAENPSLAERWELYIGGIEIANAYSELNDPEEQQRRFTETARQRHARGADVYPMNTEFMEAIKHGIPDAAGCALGFDRMLMIISNAENIDEVICARQN